MSLPQCPVHLVQSLTHTHNTMSALPGLVSLLLKGRGCSGPQAQGWRCCARLGIKVLQTANPCKGSHLLHILRARVVYPGGASGKESVCQSRRRERLGFNPWRGKIPWRREWCPHSSILAWEILCTEKSGRLVYRDVKGHGLATKQQTAT